MTAKKKIAEVKKRILLVGAECVPFAKTGGLADVIGTLPQELAKLSLDARVMLPFHRIIKDKYYNEVEHVTDFYLYLGWRRCYVGIKKLVKNDIIYYFIDNEDFFGDKIYLGGDREIEQYAFFCKAVIESLYRIDFVPDVMHLNDWQTGLIPLMLKTQYHITPLTEIKTVFTIHNMMYQGKCSFSLLEDLLGISTRYNTPEFIECDGCANFMKAGLVFCDSINTVSPSYAEEIKNPFYAYGLEGILNARSADLVGIVNGIDLTDYNPETDSHIPHHFSLSDLSGKEENKKALMEKLLLTYDEKTPLIGVVSRLTSQKGFDLVMRVFDDIMHQDVSIIILGTGDKEYEEFFRSCEARYPGRICAYIGYDNNLAHEIYAASDLFLMPSRFEPCGISQMISQRYGTLPIVRETGGLKDTVLAYDETTGLGTGFSFCNYNAHEMLGVILYALNCITHPATRKLLIENALNCNNSFELSAQKYADLYLHLL